MKQIKEKLDDVKAKKVAAIIKFDKWQQYSYNYSESKSGLLSFVRCND
jgi:hypothetical protein